MSKQQEDLQPVGEFTEQMKRAMTQRALEYTVEIKQRNARWSFGLAVAHGGWTV